MKDKFTTVVLGGGVGGLSAAFLLSRKGADVQLLEKSEELGGLAVTRERDGYAYDLGPHNIHTHFRQIEVFLKRHFKGLFVHFPQLRIFKRGKAIPYPISGANVLTTLSPWKIPLAGLDFIVRRVRMFLNLKGPDGSFRGWIVNRFGYVIYREYFHDYPEKVWRLKSNDIDRSVAETRVPVTGLLDLIKGLLRIPYKIEHQELTEHNYYLKRGIGEIPQFLAAESKKFGASLACGIHVTKICLEGNRVSGLEKIGAEGKPVWQECQNLLTTIPLGSFISLLDRVPDNVRQAAQELRYCSTILVFLKVKLENPLPSSILYFSEPEILFSRVSDVGAFSKEMVPAGKTLLCLEFPCRPDEPLWQKSIEELTAHAIDVFVAKQLLRRDDVEGSFLEKVTHSYPCFEKGYGDRLKVVIDFVKGLENVVTYGRQGGFQYINTDAVLKQGFAAATSVLVSRELGMTCQEWFQAYEGK